MRLERTGVLKGFMIFLIATEEPVSWSLAELERRSRRLRERVERSTDQTRPNAPGEVEWVFGYSSVRVERLTHSDGLEVDIASCDL